MVCRAFSCSCGRPCADVAEDGTHPGNGPRCCAMFASTGRDFYRGGGCLAAPCGVAGAISTFARTTTVTTTSCSFSFMLFCRSTFAPSLQARECRWLSAVASLPHKPASILHKRDPAVLNPAERPRIETPAHAESIALTPDPCRGPGRSRERPEPCRPHPSRQKQPLPAILKSPCRAWRIAARADRRAVCRRAQDDHPDSFELPVRSVRKASLTITATDLDQIAENKLRGEGEEGRRVHDSRAQVLRLHQACFLRATFRSS